MTEEMIIDCIHKHYDSEICNAYSNNVFSWDCSEFNNCYYKQLQRLEQENIELKEKIKAFKTMATVPTRMYNECERERCRYGKALEEIREICKCSKSPMNCDECPQNDDCEELCVNDENLQDIIYDKITEVLND